MCVFVLVCVFALLCSCGNGNQACEETFCVLHGKVVQGSRECQARERARRFRERTCAYVYVNKGKGGGITEHEAGMRVNSFKCTGASERTCQMDKVRRITGNAAGKGGHRFLERTRAFVRVYLWVFVCMRADIVTCRAMPREEWGMTDSARGYLISMSVRAFFDFDYHHRRNRCWSSSWGLFPL